MSYRLCKHCERPMRPWGSKAADHPGTATYGTSTTCNSCYKKGSEADLIRFVWPRPCMICERPMRQGKHSPKEHPNTVAHAARGLCTTCYAHERQAKKDETA